MSSHSDSPPERPALLRAAVDELPPRCREAFLLRRFAGLSDAETAARLGVSVSMVEKHVRRALAHCRDRPARADNTDDEYDLSTTTAIPAPPDARSTWYPRVTLSARAGALKRGRRYDADGRSGGEADDQRRAVRQLRRRFDARNHRRRRLGADAHCNAFSSLI